MFRFFDGLMVSLSKHSGSRWWWLVNVAMAAFILAWVILALPWLDATMGMHIGIGAFGKDLSGTLVVYGRELTPAASEVYWKVVFVGAVLSGLAIRIFDLGGLLASGYRYKVVRPGRMFSGVWTRN